MRVLVQRTKRATVTEAGKVIAEIRQGLLLFVGVGKEDDASDCEKLAQKVLNLRIFDDLEGKLNLNVKQVEGQILSVPQFTLYAETEKGNRPGFDRAADPEKARELWDKFNNLLTESGVTVQEGHFGASMEIELINDGPVTIWFDSR